LLAVGVGGARSVVYIKDKMALFAEAKE